MNYTATMLIQRSYAIGNVTGPVSALFRPGGFAGIINANSTFLNAFFLKNATINASNTDDNTGSDIPEISGLDPIPYTNYLAATWELTPGARNQGYAFLKYFYGDGNTIWAVDSDSTDGCINNGNPYLLNIPPVAQSNSDC